MAADWLIGIEQQIQIQSPRRIDEGPLAAMCLFDGLQAIKQIAETDKFDLILQDVVWVSPRLDITDRVIKALAEGK